MRLEPDPSFDRLSPRDRDRFVAAFVTISRQDVGAYLSLCNLVSQIEATLRPVGAGPVRGTGGMPTQVHRLNDAARDVAAAVCSGAIPAPTSRGELDRVIAGLRASDAIGGVASGRGPGRAESHVGVQRAVDAPSMPGRSAGQPVQSAPSEPKPQPLRVVMIEVDRSSFTTPTGTPRDGGRVRVRVGIVGPNGDRITHSVAHAQFAVLQRLASEIRRVDLGSSGPQRQLARRTLATMKRLGIRARRYEGAGPGGIEVLDVLKIVRVPTLQDRRTALIRFQDDSRRQATTGEI